MIDHVVSERTLHFDEVTLKKVHEVASNSIAAVLMFLKNVEPELVSDILSRSFNFLCI